MDILREPRYTVAATSRLVGLSQWRVRRWLRGYKSPIGKTGEIKKQSPVIPLGGHDEGVYVSFLQLIDLLFTKQFVEHHNFSPQRTRKILHEAATIVGEEHFAHRTFFTNGEQVYLELNKDPCGASELLQMLSHGQLAFGSVIAQISDQISFDSISGWAHQWFPAEGKKLVILDPQIAFGQPSVVGTRITTQNVYDFFVAEGEKISNVCSWFNLTEERVRVAVEFEQALAA